MDRFGLSRWTSKQGSRRDDLETMGDEVPRRGGRARRSAAVAVGICAVSVLAACAETKSNEPAEGVDKDITSALQEEGEVVFINPDGLMEASLQAHLLHEVVTSLGGESKLETMTDYNAMSVAMARADNMYLTDFWRWQAPDVWDKYVEEEKSIVEVSTSDYTGEEGWYVPTYVIEGDPERGIEPMCPGLPDWEALNDCADVFATSKTGDKGQYMTGAESWAPFYGDQERIDNLGLNYEMVFAGGEAALFAELQRAYQRGEPWLGLMWRPNYMTQIMDLTRIEFPPYSDECWGDTYACQWPETVIYQLASSEMEEKHPTVWNLLKNYDMPDKRLAELQSYVVDDGMTIPDAAQKWVDENPDVWQEWAKS
jgi:glycine betaine/proline transport system substrate-binding protein